MSTQLQEAFDQAVNELEFDLDDNLDDFLAGTVENENTIEAEEGLEVEGSGQGPAEDTETDDANRVVPKGPVVDVPEGGVLRLPDGTEVDAEKAVLLQADYTRKTQELSEYRKQFEDEVRQFQGAQQEVQQAYQQMRGWYEERAANPTGWIEEIVATSPDPTATIAKALYDLAHSGRLDPAFIETFGIDSGEVAEKANSYSRTPDEVAELRARLDQREMLETQQYAVSQQAAAYQSQWDQIKQANALSFEAPEAEVAAKRELLQFALESKLTRSLVDAYDLMKVRRGGITPKPAAVGPEVTANKRASRAVARKGVGSTSSGVAKQKLSTRDAAMAALDEFAAGI